MITQGEDVEIHALRKQGWSISAIARHLELDRETVRAYLGGEREAGVRRSSAPDPFEAVEAYVRRRLVDDPHVRATVLFAEALKLGYGASYPTFVRRIRNGGLRPECPACSPQRTHTDITEHPTREGKIYCAVVLDVFSRRVVGWSIDSRPQASLATSALAMAIENREPRGSTIHSDHLRSLEPASVATTG